MDIRNAPRYKILSSKIGQTGYVTRGVNKPVSVEEHQHFVMKMFNLLLKCSFANVATMPAQFTPTTNTYPRRTVKRRHYVGLLVGCVFIEQSVPRLLLDADLCKLALHLISFEDQRKFRLRHTYFCE